MQKPKEVVVYDILPVLSFSLFILFTFLPKLHESSIIHIPIVFLCVCVFFLVLILGHFGFCINGLSLLWLQYFSYLYKLWFKLKNIY